MEFSTPIPTSKPIPTAVGLGGFKVPSLDLGKAAEFNASNPENTEEGIEWAETDDDIKPEDAQVIDTSFNDLYA